MAEVYKTMEFGYMYAELGHYMFYAGSSPGGCLNINMSSYQYGDPHVKDKTVSRLSYL